ncbi:MAG TPA: hypothetical protein VGG74_06640 [Kofleriaceae bacterium]|jgi:hypothetical protein
MDERATAELARASSPLALRIATFLEPELRRIGPRAIARVGLRLLERRSSGEVAAWDRASDDELFVP